MPKLIPYGVSNYEQLVSGRYYHVDKTRAIRELERYHSSVFLRPRRFGKSVLTTMLECYYDVCYADRFEELFGGTDIGRNPTPAHSSYNVIRLSFASVGTGCGLGELEGDFNRVVHHQLCGIFRRRGMSCDCLEEGGNAKNLLCKAVDAMNAMNGRDVYVVIDEYDNFTNQLIQAGEDARYYAATGKDSFFKTFFKAVKDGMGDGSVAGCFLTGVLPVTVDDLTSGFNVATNLTLDSALHDALGFTETEIRRYTDEIFHDLDMPQEVRCKVLQDLKNYYDGYQMLPDGDCHLYNSTVCNFYLQDFVNHNGRIPTQFQDANATVDMGWLERLAGGGADVRRFVNQLVLDGRIPCAADRLYQPFNLSRFLTVEHLPVSLFFLGQLTWVSRDELGFPNVTTRMLFIERFNELNHVSVSEDDTLFAAFRRYREDDDFDALFRAYWDTYVALFPAASFGPVREHFYQMTFYYFCCRFMLPGAYPQIEENTASGRADLTFQGVAGTAQAGRAFVVEFKHRKASESLPEQALDRDVAQVTSYAEDKARLLRLPVTSYVLYTKANHGFRVFRI